VRPKLPIFGTTRRLGIARDLSLDCEFAFARRGAAHAGEYRQACPVRGCVRSFQRALWYPSALTSPRLGAAAIYPVDVYSLMEASVG
jgi:hypothetical protein